MKMTFDDLITEFSKHIDPQLAKELVSEYAQIRNDCKTGTLGRTSIGKFVETVVQLLQFLDTGKYEKEPKVDPYLKGLESNLTNLDDDLRITCARIARGCYTLRNKRSIAHKGSIDPNIYDLRYLHASAQWILSEIVHQVMQSNMATAGRMIELIQMPISSVVEDFGSRKLIFGNFTVDQEILILLHSYYPDCVPRSIIKSSLDRRSNSAISKSLTKLWKKKLIHMDNSGYKLTQEGFKETIQILQENSQD